MGPAIVAVEVPKVTSTGGSPRSRYAATSSDSVDPDGPGQIVKPVTSIGSGQSGCGGA